ncbi:MAG: minor coat protein [Zoogloeaceae bacterium]|nr:minor coat protein [Zoogloeaceae bacterium]
MSKLALFLYTFFAGILDWLLKRVTVQVATALAYAATSLALLVSLYAALKGFINGLVLFVDNPYLIMGFWLLWPSNAELCFSLIITSDLMIFIYHVHKEKLRDIHLYSVVR